LFKKNAAVYQKSYSLTTDDRPTPLAMPKKVAKARKKKGKKLGNRIFFLCRQSKKRLSAFDRLDL